MGHRNVITDIVVLIADKYIMHILIQVWIWILEYCVQYAIGYGHGYVIVLTTTKHSFLVVAGITN